MERPVPRLTISASASRCLAGVDYHFRRLLRLLRYSYCYKRQTRIGKRRANFLYWHFPEALRVVRKPSKS